MTNYREILRLSYQGISQRSIAASCACSRNTVANVHRKPGEQLEVDWAGKTTPIVDRDITYYPLESIVYIAFWLQSDNVFGLSLKYPNNL